MARRGIPLASVRPDPIGAVNPDDWAPPATEKKRRAAPTTTKQAREKFCTEAEQFRKDGAWEKFTPGHFVALYGICHERVYGCWPAELTQGAVFSLAKFAAVRILKHEFDDNVGAMRAFITWTWMREQRNEQWRRDNQKEGRRIGWKLQFSPTLVSDFRVDLSRKARRS